MATLILAREGEPELGGTLNGRAELALSERGRTEADWMGLELSRFALNAAFTAQTGTGRSTLDHIAQFQEYGVKRAAVSALNEPPGESTFKTSIYGASRRIIPFHETIIKPRLAHDETILVVAAGNVYRAYVREVEAITTAMVGDLALDRAEVRLYDISHGKLASHEILHKHFN